MIQAQTSQNWRDIFYTSQDGLKLYGRHYPSYQSQARPVLCLAGLTRNSKDFHDLATFLAHSSEISRDVYCVDYRGRGQSEHDPHPKNYTPFVEMLDVLDFMTVQGLHDAAIVGTSRGGIIAMIMAAARPTAIGAVIFNDIGPIIETTGLLRIRSYVGQTPEPKSWEEAAAIIKNINNAAFTALTEEDWLILAHQWYSERDGKPVQTYDAALSRTLKMIDLTKPLPSLWPQFLATKRFPSLVIRGENSDLLSKDTVEKMVKQNPKLETLTVPDQGHAPLLLDKPTMETIAAFLAKVDKTTAH